MLTRDRLLQLALTYWYVLVAGAFLLLYAGLGVLYLGAVQARDDKNVQLARQSAIVRGAQGLLRDVEASYQALQEGVPPATLSETQVFVAMRDLAVASELEPTYPEFSGEVAQQRVGQELYRALTFLMTVRGDPETVWAFVQMLDRGRTPFKTLVVDSATLRLGETEGEATLRFTIFTRPAE